MHFYDQTVNTNKSHKLLTHYLILVLTHNIYFNFLGHFELFEILSNICEVLNLNLSENIKLNKSALSFELYLLTNVTTNIIWNSLKQLRDLKFKLKLDLTILVSSFKLKCPIDFYYPWKWHTLKSFIWSSIPA